jgi:hypothetical protein
LSDKATARQNHLSAPHLESVGDQSFLLMLGSYHSMQKRLDRSRRVDSAHILRVPNELAENFRDGLLGVLVVAAVEYGRPSTSELRV